MKPVVFTAPVVSGSGRGKDLGIATMNLELDSVPSELTEGIYACFVMFDGKRYMAGMHYGPRPVFKDTRSCEIHILDEWIEKTPDALEVLVVGRIRDVADFPSVDDMLKQIEDDIANVRAILSAYESESPQTADS
ncbi:MAG TPA: riboflavin kinase [Candidatus Peribacteraceae bacterium]|nr:riboflavin kinase [Candidatus Peribacteraceae bacterium]